MIRLLVCRLTLKWRHLQRMLPSSARQKIGVSSKYSHVKAVHAFRHVLSSISVPPRANRRTEWVSQVTKSPYVNLRGNYQNGPRKSVAQSTMEKNKENTNGETRGNKEEAGEKKEGNKKLGDELPLMALNHVSRLCRNVKESIDFYTKVLGFVLIERPPAFDFDGAWLFNYGVGIHLVQSKDEEKLLPYTVNLDPMDNHISFQVTSHFSIYKVI